MWDAARKGDIDTLRACIGEGGDVNYRHGLVSYYSRNQKNIAVE